MILLVQHRVRDYDAWKPLFDEHEPARRKHDAIGHWVHRSLDDQNDLLVGVRFPDAQAAQGFLSDPGLKETMDRAGVEGPPTISTWDEVESKSY